MDVEEYVAARQGRLLEAAIRFGCAEDAASDVVAGVVARSARQIRKSEDPHPFVLERLRAELRGTRNTTPVAPRQAPPWQVLVVLAALVAFVIVAAVAGKQEPRPPLPLADDQVPSLFGYDAATATTLLNDRGYEVAIEPTRSCELGGRVLGSKPGVGTRLPPGGTVTIRAAVPSDVYCMAHYDERALAWRFIDFATARGPAPDFADVVHLVVDRSEPASLTGPQARRRDTWDGNSALTALAAASKLVVWDGTAYLTPELSVATGTPPATTCGIRRPLLSGERPAVSISITIPMDGPPECPVTVDLYQSYGEIDAVMLYTGKARTDR